MDIRPTQHTGLLHIQFLPLVSGDAKLAKLYVYVVPGEREVVPWDWKSNLHTPPPFHYTSCCRTVWLGFVFTVRRYKGWHNKEKGECLEERRGEERPTCLLVDSDSFLERGWEPGLKKQTRISTLLPCCPFLLHVPISNIDFCHAEWLQVHQSPSDSS